MKKYAKWYITIGAFLIVLLAVWMADAPSETRLTLSAPDKNALGGYVLNQMLPALDRGEPTSVFVPLEALHQSEDPALGSGARINILIVAPQMELFMSDWEILKSGMKRGGTALIAVEQPGPILRDSLGVRSGYKRAHLTDRRQMEELFKDSSPVQFQNLPQFPRDTFGLSANVSAYHFLPPDSLSAEFTSLATNGDGQDVLRSYPFGKGRLILCSMPTLFCNYSLMDSTSRKFAQGVLSLLNPAREAAYMEYYWLGRRESKTPLRHVLSEPALRASLYLGLAGLVIYFFSAARRRQRPIPVWSSPKNHSLDFVNTLGALHHKTSSHDQLLKKRLHYWRDFVWRRYHLPPSAENLEELQRRSLAPAETWSYLTRLLENPPQKVSEEELIKLEKQLHKFYDNP